MEGGNQIDQFQHVSLSGIITAIREHSYHQFAVALVLLFTNIAAIDQHPQTGSLQEAHDRIDGHPLEHQR